MGGNKRRQIGTSDTLCIGSSQLAWLIFNAEMAANYPEAEGDRLDAIRSYLRDCSSDKLATHEGIPAEAQRQIDISERTKKRFNERQ